VAAFGGCRCGLRGRAGIDESLSDEQVTVRARVELNRNLDPVPFPAAVLNELCSHALGAAPEECCGLVTGTQAERFQQVHRITNVMTKMHLADATLFRRDAHHAYYMAETEYLRAQKEAESRGQTVTAVYHSHVEAGAYLSEEDLVYAENPLFPFPRAAQIVLSIVAGRIKEAAIFDIDPSIGGFPVNGGRLLEVVER
jgi:proteasome lid subunit RPN8/RPN11